MTCVDILIDCFSFAKRFAQLRLLNGWHIVSYGPKIFLEICKRTVNIHTVFVSNWPPGACNDRHFTITSSAESIPTLTPSDKLGRGQTNALLPSNKLSTNHALINFWLVCYRILAYFEDGVYVTVCLG